MTAGARGGKGPKMKRTVCIALLVLFGSGPSWAGAAVESAAASLFHARCAFCHGENGTGAKDHKVTGANLHSPQVQSLSDDDLFAAIAYSAHHKDYAHAFVTRDVLTPADVHGLVRYVRSLGAKK